MTGDILPLVYRSARPSRHEAAGIDQSATLYPSPSNGISVRTMFGKLLGRRCIHTFPPRLAINQALGDLQQTIYPHRPRQYHASAHRQSVSRRVRLDVAGSDHLSILAEIVTHVVGPQVS